MSKNIFCYANLTFDSFAISLREAPFFPNFSKIFSEKIKKLKKLIEWYKGKKPRSLRRELVECKI